MTKRFTKLFAVLFAALPLTLASCQGPEGPQGEKGDQGAPGEQGPAGQNGVSVLTGEGTPLATLGNEGDSYIDLATWDYYVKEANGWVKKGNIKGADGEKGEQGQEGPEGPEGPQGEEGPEGPQGEQGPEGPQGEEGRGIEKVEIDEEGNVIVTYTDGTSEIVGNAWSDKKVTVNFYLEPKGEEPFLTREVDRGSVLKAPTAEETVGYTVTEWSSPLHEDYKDEEEPELIEWRFEEQYGFRADAVCYDVTDIYATEYAANKYTVTLKLYDEAESSYVATYDAAYEIPEPTRVGYHFTGWIDEAEKEFPASGEKWDLVEDITLTATWEINVYEINFYNGGEDPIDTQEVEHGVVPEFGGEEDPTKESTAQYDYEFDGWTDDKQKYYSLEDGLPEATANANYYAHFKPILRSYDITFYDEDGETVLGVVNTDYGVVPVFNGDTPTKEATAQYTYTFAGWTDGENFYPVGGENPVDLPECKGEASYSAYYTSVVNKYLVTFYDEDGTTKLQESKVAYGDHPTYDQENPFKEGDEEYNYYFYGWTDGTTEYAAADELPVVEEAISYSAVYKVLDNLDDFAISVSEGAATITGYVGQGGDVTIPTTYLGYPVTVIGDSAFSAKTAVKSVTLREDSMVYSIGTSAFSACLGLEEVTLGDNVATISGSAFSACTSLRTLNIGYEESCLWQIGAGAFSAVNNLVVNYAGSQSSWLYAIDISDINNDGLESATINCLVEGNMMYEIRFAESWPFDDNAAIYAWVYGGKYGNGEWVALEYTGHYSDLDLYYAILEVDDSAEGIVLARFEAGTELDNTNWPFVLNKTEDVEIEYLVDVYSTDWLELN